MLDFQEKKRRNLSQRAQKFLEGALPMISEAKDRKWSLEDIKAVHFRRYQLRRNAVELFFDDQTNFFFHFANEVERNKIHGKLVRLVRPLRARVPKTAAPSRGGTPGARATLRAFQADYHFSSGSPAEVLRKSGLTLAWQQRKLSNFDYLMHLNTIGT